MQRVVRVLMPTSAQKTFKKILSHDQGFSLIEILVALLLAALIFTALPSSEDSRRHRDLQNAVNDLDRAVRFASNESVLRNTLVRLNVNLDKMPIEYTVE
jgi:prepilin-type N-terminal cleavage/methylation domain-containing protein